MSFRQLPRHTTAVGTDHDTYFPSGGLWIPTNGASEVTLLLRRFAEMGTCTLQAFLQFYDPTLADFFDLLDEHDGTAVQSVLYTDGTVDTTGYRLLTAKSILPVGHTNGKKVYGTNYASYQVPWMPEFIRFRFRHAGTTVSNEFAATAYIRDQRR